MGNNMEYNDIKNIVIWGESGKANDALIMMNRTNVLTATLLLDASQIEEADVLFIASDPGRPFSDEINHYIRIAVSKGKFIASPYYIDIFTDVVDDNGGRKRYEKLVKTCGYDYCNVPDFGNGCPINRQPCGVCYD
jgi:hypothetical protein